MMDGFPVVLASVDDDAVPHLSFYGTTQVFDRDHLALWARDPEGGLATRILANPRVALVYRNSPERVTWLFDGIARRDDDRRGARPGVRRVAGVRARPGSRPQRDRDRDRAHPGARPGIPVGARLRHLTRADCAPVNGSTEPPTQDTKSARALGLLGAAPRPHPLSRVTSDGACRASSGSQPRASRSSAPPPRSGWRSRCSTRCRTGSPSTSGGSSRCVAVVLLLALADRARRAHRPVEAMAPRRSRCSPSCSWRWPTPSPRVGSSATCSQGRGHPQAGRAAAHGGRDLAHQRDRVRARVLVVRRRRSASRRFALEGPDARRPSCSRSTRRRRARAKWAAVFFDYFYTSFTNATAFSPTDVMPLTRWAKFAMMIESALSLMLAVLVIARAVNILK